MTVWPRTQRKRERAYARYAHCFVFSHHLLITTPSQPFRRDGRRRRPVPHLNDEEGLPLLITSKTPHQCDEGLSPSPSLFFQRAEGCAPRRLSPFNNTMRGCPPRRLSSSNATRRGAVPLAVSLLST